MLSLVSALSTTVSCPILQFVPVSALSVLDPPAKMEQLVHIYDDNNNTCLSLASTDMYIFSTLSQKWNLQPQHACMLSGLVIKKFVPEHQKASFTVSITGHGLVCADTHFAVAVRHTKWPSCEHAGLYRRCKMNRAVNSATEGLITCVAECLCNGDDCKHATIHIPAKHEDWRICEITVG